MFEVLDIGLCLCYYRSNRTYVCVKKGRVIMDGRKNEVPEMANTEHRVSSQDYRELIIEMVRKVDNQGVLEYLYTFILLF